MTGRVFAIPDIHGESEKLKRIRDLLFGRLNFSWDEDTLVYLGDFIDRGPNVKETVRQVREDAQNGAVVLLGNHEDFALKTLLRPGSEKTKRAFEILRMWTVPQNGGQNTLQSYRSEFSSAFKISLPEAPKWEGETWNCGDIAFIRKLVDFPIDDWLSFWMNESVETIWDCIGPSLRSDLEWFDSLPICYETDQFFFSHAPVSRKFANVELAMLDRDSFLRTHHGAEREDRFAMKIPGKIGVCGHIFNPWLGLGPRFYDHYYYLDSASGCHPTGRSIVANLTEREWWDNHGDYHRF